MERRGDESGREWWKDPRRVPIGRGKFVLGFLLSAGWAGEAFAAGLVSPYAAGFLVGLFVIAVVRHNARAAGRKRAWRVSSIAWVLTWAALGALALALSWGSWLGYGALAIALIALMRFGPQRGDA